MSATEQPAITYDQVAARVLLSRALTDAQRSDVLADLSREVRRRVGGRSEPCLRCGCDIYEDHDGDVVCSECGLVHGDDPEGE